jgi:hypothetical protein
LVETGSLEVLKLRHFSSRGLEPHWHGKPVFSYVVSCYEIALQKILLGTEIQAHFIFKKFYM